MGYKTKSMLHQKAATENTTYKSSYSNPKKTIQSGSTAGNSSNSSMSGNSSISGLGSLIAESMEGGRSMKTFDRRIKEKLNDGNFKRAARLEKKQAGFQRRKERASARYAERKGTEPIFSTDKEDLTPGNRRLMNKLEGTKLGDSKIVKGLEKTGILDLRKNRVSNKERKEQIARRVTENRLKRAETDDTTVPEIVINETPDLNDGVSTSATSDQNNTSTPEANNVITKQLNTSTNHDLFASVNSVFDEINVPIIKDAEKSLNPFPGVYDAFSKANSRKNK
jgi:phenylpyruvate tautomerase PptA (4-oxalocrotonate tautomerase family)